MLLLNLLSKMGGDKFHRGICIHQVTTAAGQGQLKLALLGGIGKVVVILPVNHWPCDQVFFGAKVNITPALGPCLFQLWAFIVIQPNIQT